MKKPSGNVGSRRALLSVLIHLLNEFENILIAFSDLFIVVPKVWESASAAILDAFFCIHAISAAGGAKGVQGTITEETVKIFFRNTLVAGKVFALPVLKELVVFGFFHYTSSSFPFRKYRNSVTASKSALPPGLMFF